MPITDPTDISGLVVWLPATAASRFTTIAGGTNVASDGDPIGRWEDASGNGNHFTAPADDGQRPTYDATNLGTVFDGTDAILRRTSGLGLYAGGAATLFCRIIGAGASTGGRRFTFTETDGTDPSIYSLLGSGNTGVPNQLAAWPRNSASGIAANPLSLLDDGGNTVDFWNGTDEAIIGVVDSGSDFVLWLNGVEGDPVAYTRAGTVNVDAVSVGGRATNTPASFLASTVCELIIYNRALNDTECQDVTAYLQGTEDGALSSSASAAMAMVGAANADGVLASAGVAAAEFRADGTFVMAGVGAASFVGSLLLDGTLAAAGLATVSFEGVEDAEEGVLAASGLAAASFNGTVVIDAAVVVSGAAQATFFPSILDGVWTMPGAATGVFSSIDPLDGQLEALDATALAIFVGELGFRWSSEGSVSNIWTPEGGEV